MDTFQELKKERESFYREIKQIGNFRRGTLSVTYSKCGKKNCVCTKKAHPGHGPHYLWSTTIKGKSFAKRLKLGPELQKYKEEIDNYHNFQRLCDKIIQVNKKICDLEPVPEIEEANELEALKKKLQNLYRKKYKKRLIG